MRVMAVISLTDKLILRSSPQNMLTKYAFQKEFNFIMVYEFGRYLYVTMLLLFSRSVVSDYLQPNDCSMLGFPALHHLPELAQPHVP